MRIHYVILLKPFKALRRIAIRLKPLNSFLKQILNNATLNSLLFKLIKSSILINFRKLNFYWQNRHSAFKIFYCFVLNPECLAV